MRDIYEFSPTNIVSYIVALMLTVSVDGPLNDNENDK